MIRLDVEGSPTWTGWKFAKWDNLPLIYRSQKFFGHQIHGEVDEDEF
jgi:hypothetical protein